MEITPFTYFIICPLVFLAGLADSVAGGGGIISLPAYVFTGMPLISAYGTNKFAMSLGTTVSAVKYYRNGYVRVVPVLFAVVGALIGSAGGARLAVLLDERYLGYCMMVLLPLVAVFMLINRGFGTKTEALTLPRRREYVLSLLTGLIVGAYDGFFGPGAGTFYTLLFVTLLHYDLLSASGNARVVNLASNVAALAVFIADGSVLYAVGIPAAACTIAGNFLGARLAIKNGARFVRPMIIVMVILLFIKILWDYVLPQP